MNANLIHIYLSGDSPSSNEPTIEIVEYIFIFVLVNPPQWNVELFTIYYFF